MEQFLPTTMLENRVDFEPCPVYIVQLNTRTKDPLNSTKNERSLSNNRSTAPKIPGFACMHEERVKVCNHHRGARMIRSTARGGVTRTLPEP